MRAATLLLVVLSSGCRRKHAPPVTTAPTTVENAPAPAEEVAAVKEDPIAMPVSPQVLAGHAPTDDEMRARLEPLYPKIARCVSLAGESKSTEKYLQLRFAVSPATGTAISIELEGHPEARDCTVEVLQQLRFEAWSGLPNFVQMPLTLDGKPVPLSAFADDAAAK